MTAKSRPQPQRIERKPDDPKQYERFLEAAREAKADESEAAADKAFRKVTKPADKKARK